MSTVARENETSVTAEIISVLSTGVIAAPQKNLSMEISIPNLGGAFRLQLTDLDDSEIESGRVVVRAAVDTNATMVVTLFGESASDGFHTKSFSFGFENTEKTAESKFRLATLRAALSLATQTRLEAPGLGLDHLFRLNESLRDIGEMLKLRQTMYRLMVIERAIGKRLKVPSFIPGEDMQTISLVYHAITERSFGWQFDGVLTVFYAASKEVATVLEKYKQSPDFVYPCFQRELLFGMEVPLGEGTITIINKHIENFQHVIEELRKGDGHTVVVKVRSRIGLAYYSVPDAPRIPTKVWNEDLQMLINMEDKLDDALVGRYHALAAATLEGLNENERVEITERPEIGEAFLIEDADMENV
jgi:hypothetical protein